MDKITIRVVEQKDIGIVQDFLLGQLTDLFQHEGGEALTDDVWGLAKIYVAPERNQMWGAFDQEGQVIGTIAICEYNDRIQVVKGRYTLSKTAEIGRCYLLASERRKGIGSLLLEIAHQFCQDRQYDIIYLHTHHFLPGGYHFWKKNGFTVTVDEGGDFEIVHMEKPV